MNFLWILKLGMYILENKKVRSIKKDAALIAGAALATTATGMTMHQVNVHADTVPATQTTTNAAQAAVTSAAQTNANQESALQSANAQDQQQITQIQQNASDVKAEHATEIASAQQSGQAEYQSQASQINAQYDQKIQAQSEANQQAEAETSQANSAQLASAQSAQQYAMAHATEVKSAAQSAYEQDVASAQNTQSAQTSQANSAYNQGQQQAQTAQTQAHQQAQATYNQAVKSAQAIQSQAKQNTQSTYDQAVKSENDSYNASKGNAQASRDNAIKNAQNKVAQDRNDVNAKQSAYDQAVKNSPMINHGGVKPVGNWNFHNDLGDDHDYTNVITSTDQLPLTAINTINYKPERDNSEAISSNGLNAHQYAELNEYGVALINDALKKNGLQPVVASQEIEDALTKLSNRDQYTSGQALNQYIKNATTNSQYPDGLMGSSFIYGHRNSMGNRTTEKATILSFASNLDSIVFGNLNGSAGIINTVKRMEANGQHPFINFYFDGNGVLPDGSVANDPIIIIGTNDAINYDEGTLTNNASTPLANTDFVDSIRAAQAGQATPDLNAPSVKNALNALNTAKQQLQNDQQALTNLQNGTTDPAKQAETNHNNKLASLKSAYDAAIKQADDTYNNAISQAKKVLNDANAKADSAYQDAVNALKKTHDDKINSINAAYTKTINDAKTTRDLKFQEANGDPNYLNNLKAQLQNKLNDQIKADQAKIDAIKQERDNKLAELKKSSDAKTNEAIQNILAKYGVSDAQVQAKIAPLLADIKANKEKLAQLEHEDAVAKEEAISHKSTSDAIDGVRNGSNGHYAYTSNGTTIALPEDDNVTNTEVMADHMSTKSSNGELPQTGNETASLSVLGLIAGSFAGMFGFMKRRRY